jgi:hypothetical protein
VLKGLMTFVALPILWLAGCKPTPAPSHGSVDSANNGNGPPTALLSSPSSSANTLPATPLNAEASNDSTHSPNTPPSTPLECTPKVFVRRDTITLRMEVPHGEYLGVTQPNGTPFYLINPHPGKSPDSSLLSSETFTTMPTIRLAADVRGKPLVYGRDTLETVFHEPGTYVVEIGSNLQSDQGSQIHKCTVRLVAGKR